MGGGVSSESREAYNEAQLREIVGVYWRKDIFDASKDDENKLSVYDFKRVLEQFVSRVASKYANVDSFHRDEWTPYLYSSFYEVMHRHEDRNYFEEYDSGDDEYRREAFLSSCQALDINIHSFSCKGSCGEYFSKGFPCQGLLSVTGVGRSANGSAVRCAYWEKFELADPDVLAINIWTFSMCSGPDRQPVPLYRTINAALLNEDYQMIKQLRPMMCGLIRWLRNQSSSKVPRKDVCLYRGTSIKDWQEHPLDSPLNPRYSLADVLDVDADEDFRKRAEEKSIDLQRRAGRIFRMPMFVAASEHLSKAQEFCVIKENGIACPLLEFRVDNQCDCAAPIYTISHFPDEQEWLMAAYAPVQYESQRLEVMEIGCKAQIKMVKIVTYKVLNHADVFKEFEGQGQDLRTALMLALPERVMVPCSSSVALAMPISKPWDAPRVLLSCSKPVLLQSSMVVTKHEREPVLVGQSVEEFLPKFIEVVLMNPTDVSSLFRDHQKRAARRVKAQVTEQVDAVHLQLREAGVFSAPKFVDLEKTLEELNTRTEAGVAKLVEKVSSIQNKVASLQSQIDGFVQDIETEKGRTKRSIEPLQHELDTLQNQRQALEQEAAAAVQRYCQRVDANAEQMRLAEQAKVEYIDSVFSPIEFFCRKEVIAEKWALLQMTIDGIKAQILAVEEERRPIMAELQIAKKRLEDVRAKGFTTESEFDDFRAKLHAFLLDASSCLHDLCVETATKLWESIELSD